MSRLIRVPIPFDNPCPNCDGTISDTGVCMTCKSEFEIEYETIEVEG